MAKTGTAVAVKKQKGGAVVSWEDQLKASAALYKSAEANAGGGKFISVRAGLMAFDGAPIKDNAIEAVVLESMHENAYYVDPYDADNPHPPVCFAFSDPMASLKPGEEASELENRMAPHKDSAKPQHATCKGCPKNDFGTAETGRGKACRNIRRLAILHSDYLKKPATIPSAPIAFMKVPPTSTGGWAAYVKKLANVLEKPPFAVITKVSCRPDVKKQVVVEFDVTGEVKDRNIGSAVFKRHKEAYSLMAIPYQAEAEGAAKKPAKGAKKAAKKTRKY
jgi:hypothetical protein